MLCHPGDYTFHVVSHNILLAVQDYTPKPPLAKGLMVVSPTWYDGSLRMQYEVLSD